MNDEYYKIDNKESKTKTIVFKEKDSNISIMETLEHTHNFNLVPTDKKISLIKPLPMNNKHSRPKKIITLLHFNLDVIVLTIKRVISFLLIVGIIMVTLISAFIGIG